MTINQISKMAQEHDKDWEWYDLILYWQECGNEDMEALFGSMSKRELLEVMNYLFDAVYFFIDEQAHGKSLYRKIYLRASKALAYKISRK